MKTKPKRKQLVTVTSSPVPQPHHRPIVIVGCLDGRTVAEDRTDHHGHAARIAASWRDAGLQVTISDGKESQ